MTIILAGLSIAQRLCPSASGILQPKCEEVSEVHVVAFDSKMRTSTGYLKASAEASGFTNVVILGTGVQVTWGFGMEFKINSYRQYVFQHTCECDIVLLLDGGDVLVLGGPGAVSERFQKLEMKWNRSVFFGAEPTCSQWEIPTCDKLEAITAGHGVWRFLNSGLIAGRSWALKQLLPEPVGHPIKHDQEYFRLRFIDHQSEVGIDYDTDLFLVPWVIDGIFAGEWSVAWGQPSHSIVFDELERPGVLNAMTNTRPLVLHFPGPAHWPAWIPQDGSSLESTHAKGLAKNWWHFLKGDRVSCTLHEAFIRCFPAQAENLGFTSLSFPFLSLVLPSHRPMCSGLYDKSPWQALDVLLTKICACAACVAVCTVAFLFACCWRDPHLCKDSTMVVRLMPRRLRFALSGCSRAFRKISDSTRIDGDIEKVI